jgi:hypothetical protein
MRLEVDEEKVHSSSLALIQGHRELNQGKCQLPEMTAHDIL